MSEKSDFKEGRPGYVFKDGKLYHFEKRHVLVMAPWPDPRAWVKARSHHWKPTRTCADVYLSPWLRTPCVEQQEIEPGPDVPSSGQLVLPGILDPRPGDDWWMSFERRNEQAIAAYTELIPADVLERVSRYGTRRWHVLNLFARCPGALDLDQSNPALLYALASNWVFHEPAVARPMRAARSLVFKKQQRILDWLGFPATESMRRILSRIVPASLSVEHLLYLRGSLSEPGVMACLRHTERINAGALKLLTSRTWRRYVTPRLIADVGRDAVHDDPTPPVVRLLADTVNMAEMVGRRHCPTKFVSLDRLKAVHDALAAELRPENSTEYDSLPPAFDVPPFPGTEAILPIRTPDELFQEGFLQKNCCASRAASILCGREYLYRVVRPIRATLSIIRTGNRWVADELFQAFNQPVDRRTRAAIFRELFFSARGEDRAATDLGLPLSP